VRAFQETIFVQRESWVRLLTQAPAGTSLAVVVPVPLDGGGSAKAGTLLREAIEKVNKGEYGDAVTATRSRRHGERSMRWAAAGPPRRASSAPAGRNGPWISASSGPACLLIAPGGLAAP
jgi:hypothetical protein